MPEKIYTIPVNDAFDSGAECPICFMYRELQKYAVEFIMDTAYMEDDIRMETDEKGFCEKHLSMMAAEKNRLGLALILKTHLDRQKKECLKVAAKPIKASSLFKKESSALSAWAKNANERCYICDRIGGLYPLYLDSVLYLYKKEADFRKKYAECKGFCQKHFGELIEKGQDTLPQKELEEFTGLTVKLYTDNLQRLSDDLDWFCDKFDYRYHDAPWKNSKDAIERGMVKTNGILPPEPKKP